MNRIDKIASILRFSPISLSCLNLWHLLEVTGRPGMPRFMGSQRVGHNWVTELNWTELRSKSRWQKRMNMQEGRPIELGNKLIMVNWQQCPFYSDIDLDCIQIIISSVQLSHSVMSNSLWPHGLQHARFPCPSPTPRAYSNSFPSHPWCHPTISSSVVPFSSYLQSFPASGSFPMSQFFNQVAKVMEFRLQH